MSYGQGHPEYFVGTLILLAILHAELASLQLEVLVNLFRPLF